MVREEEDVVLPVRFYVQTNMVTGTLLRFEDLHLIFYEGLNRRGEERQKPNRMGLNAEYDIGWVGEGQGTFSERDAGKETDRE